ncbi:MAG: hypothetical protein L6R40_002042 [Gallowayella cf. fulva]|nr:MAG: hypothetical protein L6R40_002042 [Xanthomendoza cf. fulva]
MANNSNSEGSVLTHLSQSTESRNDSFTNSRFHDALRDYGLTRSQNPEMYEFYRQDFWENTRAARSRTMPDVVHQILEADAYTRQLTGTSGGQWTQIQQLGRGGQANVRLWRKQNPTEDGDPTLRLAVKDAKWDPFWRDNPPEGTLLRKLNELGCKNVITVYDWASIQAPSGKEEDSVIRTCEEYAEHGDLYRLQTFYRRNQLLLPEAFIWHVFWSAASALCYCRHGTKSSPNTRVGWDPITHMDVKPANILLTDPDRSINRLYPTVKLADFGYAYTIPEKGHSMLRAWKSTFKVGTEHFQAPEVMFTNNKEAGTFHDVQPDNIHGSHSDVYSLGRTIIDLINTSVKAMKTCPDVVDRDRVKEYYSEELRSLVDLCLRGFVADRPTSYDLYKSTLEGMRKYRRIAHRERDEAESETFFHSRVLYTYADRLNFQQDPLFQMQYEMANRAPLIDGKKTADPAEDRPNDEGGYSQESMSSSSGYSRYLQGSPPPDDANISDSDLFDPNLDPAVNNQLLDPPPPDNNDNALDAEIEQLFNLSPPPPRHPRIIHTNPKAIIPIKSPPRIIHTNPKVIIPIKSPPRAAPSRPKPPATKTPPPRTNPQSQQPPLLIPLQRPHTASIRAPPFLPTTTPAPPQPPQPPQPPPKRKINTGEAEAEDEGRITRSKKARATALDPEDGEAAGDEGKGKEKKARGRPKTKGKRGRPKGKGKGKGKDTEDEDDKEDEDDNEEEGPKAVVAKKGRGRGRPRKR